MDIPHKLLLKPLFFIVFVISNLVLYCESTELSSNALLAYNSIKIVTESVATDCSLCGWGLKCVSNGCACDWGYTSSTQPVGWGGSFTTCIVSCTDGIMNGDEEGIDCGGDCATLCTSSPSCYDNIMNGDETDVDCGGSCMSCSSCSGMIRGYDIQVTRSTELLGSDGTASHVLSVLCKDSSKTPLVGTIVCVELDDGSYIWNFESKPFCQTTTTSCSTIDLGLQDILHITKVDVSRGSIQIVSRCANSNLNPSIPFFNCLDNTWSNDHSAQSCTACSSLYEMTNFVSDSRSLQISSDNTTSYSSQCISGFSSVASATSCQSNGEWTVSDSLNCYLQFNTCGPFPYNSASGIIVDSFNTSSVFFSCRSGSASYSANICSAKYGWYYKAAPTCDSIPAQCASNQYVADDDPFILVSILGRAITYSCRGSSSVPDPWTDVCKDDYSGPQIDRRPINCEPDDATRVCWTAGKLVPSVADSTQCITNIAPPNVYCNKTQVILTVGDRVTTETIPVRFLGDESSTSAAWNIYYERTGEIVANGTSYSSLCPLTDDTSCTLNNVGVYIVGLVVHDVGGLQSTCNERILVKPADRDFDEIEICAFNVLQCPSDAVCGYVEEGSPLCVCQDSLKVFDDESYICRYDPSSVDAFTALYPSQADAIVADSLIGVLLSNMTLCAESREVVDTSGSSTNTQLSFYCSNLAQCVISSLSDEDFIDAQVADVCICNSGYFGNGDTCAVSSILSDIQSLNTSSDTSNLAKMHATLQHLDYLMFKTRMNIVNMNPVDLISIVEMASSFANNYSESLSSFLEYQLTSTNSTIAHEAIMLISSLSFHLVDISGVLTSTEDFFFLAPPYYKVKSPLDFEVAVSLTNQIASLLTSIVDTTFSLYSNAYRYRSSSTYSDTDWDFRLVIREYHPFGVVNLLFYLRVKLSIVLESVFSQSYLIYTALQDDLQTFYPVFSRRLQKIAETAAADFTSIDKMFFSELRRLNSVGQEDESIYLYGKNGFSRRRRLQSLVLTRFKDDFESIQAEYAEDKDISSAMFDSKENHNYNMRKLSQYTMSDFVSAYLLYESAGATLKENSESFTFRLRELISRLPIPTDSRLIVSDDDFVNYIVLYGGSSITATRTYRDLLFRPMSTNIKSIYSSNPNSPYVVVQEMWMTDNYLVRSLSGPLVYSEHTYGSTIPLDINGTYITYPPLDTWVTTNSRGFSSFCTSLKFVASFFTYSYLRPTLATLRIALYNVIAYVSNSEFSTYNLWNLYRTTFWEDIYNNTLRYDIPDFSNVSSSISEEPTSVDSEGLWRRLKDTSQSSQRVEATKPFLTRRSKSFAQFREENNRLWLKQRLEKAGWNFSEPPKQATVQRRLLHSSPNFETQKDNKPVQSEIISDLDWDTIFSDVSSADSSKFDEPLVEVSSATFYHLIGSYTLSLELMVPTSCSDGSASTSPLILSPMDSTVYVSNILNPDSSSGFVFKIPLNKGDLYDLFRMASMEALIQSVESSSPSSSASRRRLDISDATADVDFNKIDPSLLINLDKFTEPACVYIYYPSSSTNTSSSSDDENATIRSQGCTFVSFESTLSAPEDITTAATDDIVTFATCRCAHLMADEVGLGIASFSSNIQVLSNYLIYRSASPRNPSTSFLIFWFSILFLILLISVCLSQCRPLTDQALILMHLNDVRVLDNAKKEEKHTEKMKFIEQKVRFIIPWPLDNICVDPDILIDLNYDRKTRFTDIDFKISINNDNGAIADDYHTKYNRLNKNGILMAKKHSLKVQSSNIHSESWTSKTAIFCKSVWRKCCPSLNNKSSKNEVLSNSSLPKSANFKSSVLSSDGDNKKISNTKENSLLIITDQNESASIPSNDPKNEPLVKIQIHPVDFDSSPSYLDIKNTVNNNISNTDLSNINTKSNENIMPSNRNPNSRTTNSFNNPQDDSQAMNQTNHRTNKKFISPSKNDKSSSNKKPIDSSHKSPTTDKKVPPSSKNSNHSASNSKEASISITPLTKILKWTVLDSIQSDVNSEHSHLAFDGSWKDIHRRTILLNQIQSIPLCAPRRLRPPRGSTLRYYNFLTSSNSPNTAVNRIKRQSLSLGRKNSHENPNMNSKLLNRINDSFSKKVNSRSNPDDQSSWLSKSENKFPGISNSNNRLILHNKIDSVKEIFEDKPVNTTKVFGDKNRFKPILNDNQDKFEFRSESAISRSSNDALGHAKDSELSGDLFSHFGSDISSSSMSSNSERQAKIDSSISLYPKTLSFTANSMVSPVFSLEREPYNPFHSDSDFVSGAEMQSVSLSSSFLQSIPFILAAPKRLTYKCLHSCIRCRIDAVFRRQGLIGGYSHILQIFQSLKQWRKSIIHYNKAMHSFLATRKHASLFNFSPNSTEVTQKSDPPLYPRFADFIGSELELYLLPTPASERSSTSSSSESSPAHGFSDINKEKIRNRRRLLRLQSIFEEIQAHSKRCPLHSAHMILIPFPSPVFDSSQSYSFNNNLISNIPSLKNPISSKNKGQSSKIILEEDHVVRSAPPNLFSFNQQKKHSSVKTSSKSSSLNMLSIPPLLKNNGSKNEGVLTTKPSSSKQSSGLIDLNGWMPIAKNSVPDLNNISNNNNIHNQQNITDYGFTPQYQQQQQFLQLNSNFQNSAMMNPSGHFIQNHFNYNEPAMNNNQMTFDNYNQIMSPSINYPSHFNQNFSAIPQFSNPLNMLHPQEVNQNINHNFMFAENGVDFTRFEQLNGDNRNGSLLINNQTTDLINSNNNNSRNTSKIDQKHTTIQHVSSPHILDFEEEDEDGFSVIFDESEEGVGSIGYSQEDPEINDLISKSVSAAGVRPLSHVQQSRYGQKYSMNNQRQNLQQKKYGGNFNKKNVSSNINDNKANISLNTLQAGNISNKKSSSQSAADSSSSSHPSESILSTNMINSTNINNNNKSSPISHLSLSASPTLSPVASASNPLNSLSNSFSSAATKDNNNGTHPSKKSVKKQASPQNLSQSPPGSLSNFNLNQLILHDVAMDVSGSLIALESIHGDQEDEIEKRESTFDIEKTHPFQLQSPILEGADALELHEFVESDDNGDGKVDIDEASNVVSVIDKLEFNRRKSLTSNKPSSIVLRGLTIPSAVSMATPVPVKSSDEAEIQDEFFAINGMLRNSDKSQNINSNSSQSHNESPVFTSLIKDHHNPKLDNNAFDQSYIVYRQFNKSKLLYYSSLNGNSIISSHPFSPKRLPPISNPSKCTIVLVYCIHYLTSLARLVVRCVLKIYFLYIMDEDCYFRTTYKRLKSLEISSSLLILEFVRSLHSTRAFITPDSVDGHLDVKQKMHLKEYWAKIGDDKLRRREKLIMRTNVQLNRNRIFQYARKGRGKLNHADLTKKNLLNPQNGIERQLFLNDIRQAHGRKLATLNSADKRKLNENNRIRNITNNQNRGNLKNDPKINKANGKNSSPNKLSKLWLMMKSFFESKDDKIQKNSSISTGIIPSNNHNLMIKASERLRMFKAQNNAKMQNNNNHHKPLDDALSSLPSQNLEVGRPTPPPNADMNSANFQMKAKDASVPNNTLNKQKIDSDNKNKSESGKNADNNNGLLPVDARFARSVNRFRLEGFSAARTIAAIFQRYEIAEMRNRNKFETEIMRNNNRTVQLYEHSNFHQQKLPEANQIKNPLLLQLQTQFSKNRNMNVIDANDGHHHILADVLPQPYKPQQKPPYNQHLHHQQIPNPSFAQEALMFNPYQGFNSNANFNTNNNNFNSVYGRNESQLDQKSAGGYRFHSSLRQLNVQLLLQQRTPDVHLPHRNTSRLIEEESGKSQLEPSNTHYLFDNPRRHSQIFPIKEDFPVSSPTEIFIHHQNKVAKFDDTHSSVNETSLQITNEQPGSTGFGSSVNHTPPIVSNPSPSIDPNTHAQLVSMASILLQAFQQQNDKTVSDNTTNSVESGVPANHADVAQLPAENMIGDFLGSLSHLLQNPSLLNTAQKSSINTTQSQVKSEGNQNILEEGEKLKEDQVEDNNLVLNNQQTNPASLKPPTTALATELIHILLAATAQNNASSITAGNKEGSSHETSSKVEHNKNSCASIEHTSSKSNVSAFNTNAQTSKTDNEGIDSLAEVKNEIDSMRTCTLHPDSYEIAATENTLPVLNPMSELTSNHQNQIEDGQLTFSESLNLNPYQAYDVNPTEKTASSVSNEKKSIQVSDESIAQQSDSDFHSTDKKNASDLDSYTSEDSDTVDKSTSFSEANSHDNLDNDFRLKHLNQDEDDNFDEEEEEEEDEEEDDEEDEDDGLDREATELASAVGHFLKSKKRRLGSNFQSLSHLGGGAADNLKPLNGGVGRVIEEEEEEEETDDEEFKDLWEFFDEVPFNFQDKKGITHFLNLFSTPGEILQRFRRWDLPHKIASVLFLVRESRRHQIYGKGTTDIPVYGLEVSKAIRQSLHLLKIKSDPGPTPVVKRKKKQHSSKPLPKPNKDKKALASSSLPPATEATTSAALTQVIPRKDVSSTDSTGGLLVGRRPFILDAISSVSPQNKVGNFALGKDVFKSHVTPLAIGLPRVRTSPPMSPRPSSAIGSQVRRSLQTTQPLSMAGLSRNLQKDVIMEDAIDEEIGNTSSIMNSSASDRLSPDQSVPLVLNSHLHTLNHSDKEESIVSKTENVKNSIKNPTVSSSTKVIPQLIFESIFAKRNLISPSKELQIDFENSVDFSISEDELEFQPKLQLKTPKEPQLVLQSQISSQLTPSTIPLNDPPPLNVSPFNPLPFQLSPEPSSNFSKSIIPSAVTAVPVIKQNYDYLNTSPTNNSKEPFGNSLIYDNNVASESKSHLASTVNKQIGGVMHEIPNKEAEIDLQTLLPKENSIIIKNSESSASSSGSQFLLKNAGNRNSYMLGTHVNSNTILPPSFGSINQLAMIQSEANPLHFGGRGFSYNHVESDDEEVSAPFNNPWVVHDDDDDDDEVLNSSESSTQVLIDKDCHKNSREKEQQSNSKSKGIISSIPPIIENQALIQAQMKIHSQISNSLDGDLEAHYDYPSVWGVQNFQPQIGIQQRNNQHYYNINNSAVNENIFRTQKNNIFKANNNNNRFNSAAPIITGKINYSTPAYAPAFEGDTPSLQHDIRRQTSLSVDGNSDSFDSSVSIPINKHESISLHPIDNHLISSIAAAGSTFALSSMEVFKRALKCSHPLLKAFLLPRDDIQPYIWVICALCYYSLLFAIIFGLALLEANYWDISPSKDDLWILKVLAAPIFKIPTALLPFAQPLVYPQYAPSNRYHIYGAKYTATFESPREIVVDVKDLVQPVCSIRVFFLSILASIMVRTFINFYVFPSLCAPPPPQIVTAQMRQRLHTKPSLQNEIGDKKSSSNFARARPDGLIDASILTATQKHDWLKKFKWSHYICVLIYICIAIVCVCIPMIHATLLSTTKPCVILVELGSVNSDIYDPLYQIYQAIPSDDLVSEGPPSYFPKVRRLQNGESNIREHLSLSASYPLISKLLQIKFDVEPTSFNTSFYRSDIGENINVPFDVNKISVIPPDNILKNKMQSNSSIKRRHLVSSSPVGFYIDDDNDFAIDYETSRCNHQSLDESSFTNWLTHYRFYATAVFILILNLFISPILKAASSSIIHQSIGKNRKADAIFNAFPNIILSRWLTVSFSTMTHQNSIQDLSYFPLTKIPNSLHFRFMRQSSEWLLKRQKRNLSFEAMRRIEEKLETEVDLLPRDVKKSGDSSTSKIPQLDRYRSVNLKTGKMKATAVSHKEHFDVRQYLDEYRPYSIDNNISNSDKKKTLRPETQSKNTQKKKKEVNDSAILNDGSKKGNAPHNIRNATQEASKSQIARNGKGPSQSDSYVVDPSSEGRTQTSSHQMENDHLTSNQGKGLDPLISLPESMNQQLISQRVAILQALENEDFSSSELSSVKALFERQIEAITMKKKRDNEVQSNFSNKVENKDSRNSRVDKTKILVDDSTNHASAQPKNINTKDMPGKPQTTNIFSEGQYNYKKINLNSKSKKLKFVPTPNQTQKEQKVSSNSEIHKVKKASPKNYLSFFTALKPSKTSINEEIPANIDYEPKDDSKCCSTSNLCSDSSALTLSFWLKLICFGNSYLLDRWKQLKANLFPTKEELHILSYSPSLFSLVHQPRLLKKKAKLIWGATSINDFHYNLKNPTPVTPTTKNQKHNNKLNVETGKSALVNPYDANRTDDDLFYPNVFGDSSHGKNPSADAKNNSNPTGYSLNMNSAAKSYESLNPTEKLTALRKLEEQEEMKIITGKRPIDTLLLRERIRFCQFADVNIDDVLKLSGNRDIAIHSAYGLEPC